MVIAKSDLIVLRRDPFPLVFLIAMPLLLMAFVRPAYKILLSQEGFPAASGAEQAVPGVTIFAAFLLIMTIGHGFFREYGWRTWPRLCMSCRSRTELFVGKALSPLLIVAVQFALLFGVGWLFLDLRIRGSLLALAVVLAALGIFLVAAGLALVVACRTLSRLNALASLGGLALSALGGAIVPRSALPAWASAVAPLMPSYWAMRAVRAVLLQGGGLMDILPDCLSLVGVAAALLVVSLWRFDPERPKEAWA